MDFSAVYSPIRRFLPKPIAQTIRSVATALIAPTYRFYRNGHFRSAFARAAVDRHGAPLPWYTYGCIYFLQNVDFAGRRVLEFGGGQSTLWWAKRAREVLAFDSDKDWCERISKQLPPNARMQLVSLANAEHCVRDVSSALAGSQKFDIVVIDGLYRAEMVPIAIASLTPDGAIICDDSEGYGFFKAFANSGLQRVDFFGVQPGVILSGATSIFFADKCFLFNNRAPITPPP